MVSQRTAGPRGTPRLAAMAARICRSVLAEGHDAFFVKQLQEMGEPLSN